MKRPENRSILRQAIALLCISALLLTLCGCGISQRAATRKIKRYIRQTYGWGYSVSEVHSCRIDAGMFGTTKEYRCTVTHNKTDLCFAARCSGFGNSMRDYYAKALYEEELDRKLAAVFESHPDICFENLNIQWFPSPEDWQPTVPFEDFFAETEIIKLEADLTVPEAGLEQRGDELFRLFQELEADNIDLAFTLRTDAGDCMAQIKLLPDHQLDPEVLQADLDYFARLLREERQFVQLVDDYLQEYPLMHQVDRDVWWNRGNTHRFVMDLVFTEQVTDTRVQELFGLIQRLDAQGFDYTLHVDGHLLLGGESKKCHIRVTKGEITSLDQLRQQLPSTPDQPTTDPGNPS